MALQHLVTEEAEKLAKGGGSRLDPYAWERPLERANRMSRSSEQLTIYDVKGNAIPVAAIGHVDVTDPWGNALIGMDSPYDASIAYASNPTRMASRQSMYYGAFPTTPKATSPALSGRSSMTGSSSGTPMVWSEVSSSISGMSSNWQDPSFKRRSVSFHGDLNQAGMGGRRSPGASSMQDRPRSEFGDRRPSLKTRSTTNLPSLLGNGRRTFDAESRKSFIDQELPPIPVDPKLAAKRERRQSKAAGLSANKDKSDTLSMMSGISGSGDGTRASKRKSWFARSPSSDAHLTVDSHTASSSSKAPPLPSLPSRHTGLSAGSGRSSGGNSPVSGSPLHSPSMLAPSDMPFAASPPSVSPVALPSRLSPSSAMPPSRSYRNMPSPVDERPESQMPTMSPSTSHFPASIPNTPMEAPGLAPAVVLKPSPSSPPSFGLHQMASSTVEQAQHEQIDVAPQQTDTPLPKGINKSLSSFQMTAKPVSPLTSRQPSRKPSQQSLLPEQVPLPPTPDTPTHAYTTAPSSRTSTPLASPAYPKPGSSPAHTAPVLGDSMTKQVQPASLPSASGLVVPTVGDSQASSKKGKQLKPRASSPNLGQSKAPEVAAVPLPAMPEAALSLSSGSTVRPRKTSKSPFAIFKRGRSKTLGETEQSGKATKGTATPPLPTPQLSLSSSVASTTASQPLEDFYADFTPAARPSFTPSRKGSSFNIFGTKRSKGPSNEAVISK